MNVNIKSRQEGLIEDVNLEIQVRYMMRFKEGLLTLEKLQTLDSLFIRVGYFYSNKIKSINGLENCTNLSYLSLSMQSITE